MTSGNGFEGFHTTTDKTMNLRHLVNCGLCAAITLQLAGAGELFADPAPFPTTIPIRDVSQPPSAGREPVPFVPKPYKPRKPGTRKPAKPPRSAAAKPAQAPPVQAAKTAPPQEPQAAPALPTPEELNRRYSTQDQTLSPLAVGPVPGPAAAPAPAPAPHTP